MVNMQRKIGKWYKKFKLLLKLEAGVKFSLFKKSETAVGHKIYDSSALVFTVYLFFKFFHIDVFSYFTLYFSERPKGLNK